jgi:hypothetical protein
MATAAAGYGSWNFCEGDKQVARQHVVMVVAGEAPPQLGASVLVALAIARACLHERHASFSDG